MKTRQDTVWRDLYGNGQPGHMATVNDFISSAKGQFRLVVGLITAFGVASTALLGYMALFKH